MTQSDFGLWGAALFVAVLLDMWLVRWQRQRKLEGKPPLVEALLAAVASAPARARASRAAVPAAGAPVNEIEAAAPAPETPQPSPEPAQVGTPQPHPAHSDDGAALAPEAPQAAPAVETIAAPTLQVQAEAPSAQGETTTAPAAASGVSRVHVSFELAPGARARVTIESLEGAWEPVTVIGDPGEPAATIAIGPPRRASAQVAPPAPRLAALRAPQVAPPKVKLPALGGLWAPLQPLWRRVSEVVRAQTAQLDQVLFWSGLALYVATRFIGLDRFPIYFFTDEAVQTVLAANFIRDGFADHLGEVLPTYFQNGPFWNLSVSVYLQVLPYLIFGKSILVTRGTSALVTVLAVVSVGLILKQIFKVPYWWAGVLLLSVAPAWFLHSRTAFETAEMTAIYAAFLYAYLLYRYRSPRYLYLTLVLGALAFYAYSPGEMVILVTGVLLLISDLRYHYANRKMALKALTLAAVLALPYLRFRLAHPQAVVDQLRERGSYLVDPNLDLSTKLQHTWDEYRYGLSVAYWFLPNGRDLGRHVMAGYGNLPLFTLPLAIVGLVVALRNLRSPAHRAVLLALLASPTGGALADIGVTRVLMFVIPAVLLAALGLSTALEWLEKRRAPRAPMALGVFALLAGFNIYMLRDALTDGPLWVRDYGLGGMQYGAQQLFHDTLPDLLKRDPNVTVSVTSTWANAPDMFVQFFLTPEQQARVQMLNLDYFLLEQRDLPPDLLLVMTSAEYQRAIASPKLKPVEVTQVLPYPDGSPGFYFTRIAYSDNAAAAFAEERRQRQALETGEIEVNGERWTVSYSALSGGQLRDMLDGDRFTLARGYEANPFVIEIEFPSPRAITGLAADFGSMEAFTVTARLYETTGSEPVVYDQTFTGLPPDPHVDLAFEGGPASVSKVRLEILNRIAGEVANVHVREIAFR